MSLLLLNDLKANLVFGPLVARIEEDHATVACTAQPRNHETILGCEEPPQFPAQPLKLALIQATTKDRVLEAGPVSLQ